jgi:predicted nucleic-acid-binding Zn-ribbon protein
MSTGIDIKFVQERYERMSDDELIRIATQDAYDLTPEAMEVVKAEIQKRGLDENISKGVEAQNKEYTIEEIDTYCDIVSNLSCPSCGNTSQRLNATMTGEVISFIFFTDYKKKIKIGCPPCLDKANNNALTKTAIFGWWGFPWGIIRTPQAITLNLESKRTNHLQEHNDYLRNFTLSIIGELEAYHNSKEKLQQIISRQNGL